MKFLNFKFMINVLFWLLILAGLYVISLYNYLLFHAIAEIFSIVIAFSIFVLSINSEDSIEEKYVFFLGIAYLFIGSIDLLHTLSYSGMSIFPGYSADLPTQLWIFARYLESISLLFVVLFLSKRINRRVNAAVYTCITISGLVLIFTGFFPSCFIENQGLTPFKKISEVIISIILLGAVILAFKKRSFFHHSIFYLFVFSVAVTIVSELSFMFYKEVTGFFNLLGHFFKIISFFYIYKAVVAEGIRKPYISLRENEEILNKTQQISHLGSWILDIEKNNLSWSDEVYRIFGIEKENFEATYEAFLNTVHPDDLDMVNKAYLDAAENKVPYDIIHRIVRPGGEVRFVHEKSEELLNPGGKVVKSLGMVHDITEWIQAEKEIEKRLEEKEILLRELYHRTKNNMQVISGLLRLQSVYSDNKEIKKALKAAENRISALALVHKKLYKAKNLSRISLKEYVTDLITLIVESYRLEQNNVSVEITGEDMNVLMDMVIPLGLVLNELVSNMCKHAFSEKGGTIFLSIKRTAPAQIKIILKDNGRGIPEDFEIKKSQTLGIPTAVQIIEKQLSGTISFENDNGLKWSLLFQDNLYDERITE